MHTLLFLTAILLSRGTFAQLSGTYTIGGISPDYITINDAVDDLTLSGVSGPVVFNIRDGVYNEQVQFTTITGVSATNTVTVQSESGDSTAVTITFDADQTSINGTITLFGVSHITLRHLTIETQATLFDMGMELEGTQHITIEHCILQASNSNCTGSDEEALIAANNVPASLNLTVRNNVIRNHCRGVELAHAQNVLIEGNTFSGISDYGISAAICDTTIIRENQTTSYIINFFFQNEVLSIHNNRIFGRLVFDGSSGDANTPAEVFNNFFTGNSVFETYYCEYLNIQHNSFYCSGAALWFNNTDAFVNVQNNVFHMYNNGRILSSSTPMTQITSDHNDMYSSGPNFVQIDGIDYADLAAWQNFSGQDANSISVDPGFVSTTDLHATSPDLIGAGMAGLGIDTDIDGEMRSVNPDIGADEFGMSTSISTSTYSPALVLFPNPTEDMLRIQNWNGSPASYSIQDVRGREILSGQYNGGTIDVQDLPSGVYILSFVEDSERLSGTFRKR